MNEFQHQIDAIVGHAIAEHVFPGAVVLVAQAGQIVHHRAYGTTMYNAPESCPVERSTIYDIASLTKMFTASAALRLIDQGVLALDAPVRTYLPQFQPEDVTLWHLLTHTSGLDIRLSALRELGPQGMINAVYQTVPTNPPGSKVAYTNVNSLLLGAIITRTQHVGLDSAIAALITRPLGLRETCFLPPVWLLPRIAPTELDESWRGGLVHGTVHDESTHALGGVAGHAGMFSTAQELWMFCQSWLDATQDHGSPFLSTTLARQATTNQTPDHTLACGLGWMMNRPNFMGCAPAGSFGHTGFTGPAMVVVPSHATVVIVLNNRVYPRRGPAAHHATIAAIVEAALDAA